MTRVLLLLLCAGTVAAAAAGGALGASTLVVDDDLACAGAAYATIGAAVSAASPGDTVEVCAGAYREQVVIDMSLTLQGDPGAVVEAVDNQAGASIYVHDTSDVTISGLTLEGRHGAQANGCQGGAARFRGILFERASGAVIGNTVDDYRKADGLTGCQEGNGIELRGDTFAGVSSWPYALDAEGNTVTGYQKGGIVANGNVVLTALGNTVTGRGPVGVPEAASNGIQIAFGGTGTVEENAISGNDYTPKSFVACGLLVFEANGVRASQNHYSANEINFCNFGSRGGGQSAVD